MEVENSAGNGNEFRAGRKTRQPYVKTALHWGQEFFMKSGENEGSDSTVLPLFFHSIPGGRLLARALGPLPLRSTIESLSKRKLPFLELGSGQGMKDGWNMRSKQ